MKGCFSSDLCNVLLFRGYSQHLERPKPASLPVIATSLLAIPAAPQSLLLEKEQLCPPSQPRAPFLSLVPAVALTESLELRQKTSPATCFGKPALISPEHIGFQWDQVPEGKAAFFCSISDLSQHKLFEFFCMLRRWWNSPFFSEPFLRQGRGDNTKKGSRLLVVNHSPERQQHGWSSSTLFRPSTHSKGF